MKKSIISIIIPVYNAQDYLNQCLDSVLSQTFAQIEVICVDDGSTDASRDILEQYARNDARIFVKTQDNKGPGLARNLALSEAKGKYIVFMDSDDMYPSQDTLEKLLSTAEMYQSKIVGGYRMILKNGEACIEEYDPVYQIIKDNPDGGYIEYSQLQTDFNYQCYMYDREFLEENHIVFPDYRRFQDPPFFVRAMCAATGVYLIPYSTYLYRWGHQNINWTSLKINDMLRGNIDVLTMASEERLNMLYRKGVRRLSNNYKEIILSGISLDNLNLYILALQLYTIEDPSRIDNEGNDARAPELMKILALTEKKFAELVSAKYSLGGQFLLDFLCNIRNDFLILAPDNEQIVVCSLLRLLSNMFTSGVSYPARIILRDFLLSQEYKKLDLQTHPEDWYDDTAVKAIQILNGIQPAFDFAEKLANISIGKNCHVVHDCYVKNAKFSVIIPVYNVAPFLPECLDSIVTQTLSDIEIICVEDGSTDNSYAILMEYAGKYSNIRVLRENNAGLSAARNRGLEAATGDFIHFLDSDDFMQKDAYEKLYNTMKEKKLDLLFFSGRSFYETEELEEQYPWYSKAYSYRGEKEKVQNGEEYYVDAVLNHTFNVHACMYAVNRKLLIDQHLRFVEGAVHEDNYFTNACTLMATRVSRINQPFYQRRIREGSLTIRPLEFRHSYGYFINFWNLHSFVAERQLHPDTLAAVELKLSAMMSNANTSYKKIQDESQKNYFLALPPMEAMLFEHFIYRRFKIQEDLEARIKKISDEKAEINRKLQKAYEEKSEINQKLQRTYAEKSEINRKLKKTYDEKFERGVRIKELEKELVDKTDQIKKLECSSLASRIINKMKQAIKRICHNSK